MPVERAAGGTSLIDVLDRVLDKGIVIDAWVRVSLVGIDLITVEARIVVASIDTYLKYSEAVGQVAPVSKPAIEGKGYEEVIAENAALRAQLKASALPSRARGRRRARRPAAKRNGQRRTRASRACASQSSEPSAATTSCSRHACACSRPSSAGRRSPTARSSRCSGSASRSACRQSICLVRPAGEQSLFVVGAHGLPGVGAHVVHRLARGLGQPARHRVQHTASELFFPRRAFRRRSQAPSHDAPSRTRRSTSCRSACPAFRRTRSGCCCSAARRRCRRSCAGSRPSSARSCDQLLRHQALTEGDRKQGRERSLLHSIINAVTDPILLTDTEGRLLIANARALTLFTASEEESEGRRGAVRMNNMLLSSALSSKAIEETGAARRELLLVNPVDGSDLVFELLSTVTEDPRQGSGVVSILRNVTDLRRASEEIEENYRKMRIAEVQARAESDRLNLIIDSVADPIVVTDAAGATSLMNEPAERLFTLPAARERRSSSAGCRPTTRTSRRSSPACWSAPTSAASARSA